MKTILCYGDSNLRGYIPGSFDEKLGLSARYPKSKRWTGILQHRLGSEYVVVEEGLNGRTTTLNEIAPGRPYRNGLEHLPMFLESHFPVDLVVFMLGTNDTKVQFKRSTSQIAEGMRDLVNVVKSSNLGASFSAPKILIIASPPLVELALLKDEYFDGSSYKKSKELAALYQQLAREEGCEFLDASLIIKSSEVDGVHFDEHQNVLLGSAVADKVRNVLSS